MQNNNKFLLPLSIIIAGALIGGALYLGNNKGSNTAENPEKGEVAGDYTNLKPVDSEDHIFGNPDAPIKFVEFSDPQCHFCRAFHPTMKRIMEEYGEDGKVAWVYRHFAILGPTSEKEAEATECAAEQGGDEAFWQYLDLMFETKEDSGRFPTGESIQTVAEAAGLDVEAFNSCVESGKYKETIASMREDAISVGGKGTPYTLIIDSEGELIAPLNGALPYENIKTILDEAIANL